MRGFFISPQKNIFYRCLSGLIVFVLTFLLIFSPAAGYAQSVFTLSGVGGLNLPVPGTMVTPSHAFAPVLLKGMTIYPDDPLKFDFIIDSGNTYFTIDEIKKETERLVKYFLASMTVPKDNLWVNLSPYEDDRIIPEELGKTELGRDMLAQDYILKQLTASLMYPEEELGKKFWDKVYKKAEEQFGTSEIPVNTFNKVWILPENATVYEHEQTVYVVNAKLKVMLDSDYLAMNSNVGTGFKPVPTDQDLSVSTGIIREIIIPEIEREVNEGEHFAPLRQIYHSLILAKWYKETVKNSLLSQVYVDQNKIAGVDLDDKTVKDQIYARYMEAYKKGVFNYIREDYNRLSQEIIPRKYFSGGLLLIGAGDIHRTSSPVNESKNPKYRASVEVTPQKFDQSSSPIIQPMLNVLQQRDEFDARTIRDIIILGNYNLETFREALRVHRESGKKSRMVITGGRGRFIETTIAVAEKYGVDFTDIDRESVSEAELIDKIIIKMVQEEEEFSDLNVDLIGIRLESNSSNTPQNIQFYRRDVLEKDNNRPLEQGEYNVLFIQTPHQQLRSKATFDKIFPEKNITGFSHTVNYDIDGRSRYDTVKDMLEEAWRLLLYSQERGNGTINLHATFRGGADGIPTSFWQNALNLFGGLDLDEQYQLAQNLKIIMEKTKKDDKPLSFGDLMSSAQKNNPIIDKFVQTIKEEAASPDSSIGKASSSPVETKNYKLSVQGRFFKPKLDFDLDQPLSADEIKKLRSLMKRDSKAVRQLFEEAEKRNITLRSSAYLRGADILGSSLDLRSWIFRLTKKGIRGFDKLPSTITVASNHKLSIRCERAENGDENVYVAPVFGLTKDNPRIYKGEIVLKNGKVPNGIVDAVQYIVMNVFGITGVKFILEPTTAMSRAGGMEASGTFLKEILSVISIMTGADLSEADLNTLVVKFENNEFGNLAGFQGPYNATLGGVQQIIMTSGIKDSQDHLVSPNSVVAVPLLNDEKLRSLENVMMTVQAGKPYKDGQSFNRTAGLVNTVWTDLLVDEDTEALPLFFELLELTTQTTAAFENAQWDKVSRVMMRYAKIRDRLVKRWLNLMLDAHTGKKVPEYAKAYADKVFNPDNEYYKDFEVVRDVFNEQGEDTLRETRLYAFGPMGSLSDDAREEGIALVGSGASGPGANMFALDPQGKDHLLEFLHTKGFSEIDETEALALIEGRKDGILKGYLPFKIGSEGIQYEGFAQLGLNLPVIPDVRQIKGNEVGLSSSPVEGKRTDIDIPGQPVVRLKENYTFKEWRVIENSLTEYQRLAGGVEGLLTRPEGFMEAFDLLKEWNRGMEFDKEKPASKLNELIQIYEKFDNAYMEVTDEFKEIFENAREGLVEFNENGDVTVTEINAIMHGFMDKFLKIIELVRVIVTFAGLKEDDISAEDLNKYYKDALQIEYTINKYLQFIEHLNDPDQITPDSIKDNREEKGVPTYGYIFFLIPYKKLIMRESGQNGEIASTSSPINARSKDIGGIDLNTIEVDRQGAGVDIRFDPVEARQIIDMGIDGFAPVIINLIPLPSVLPLLGLSPQRKEDEEFEISRK